MAQTTTAVNACDVAIWLDNASGTQQDISGSTNTASMAFTNQLGAVRNFGTRWMIRLECGKDATFNISAVYSTAQNEAIDILKNWYFNNPGDRTLTIYIPDKNVGSDVYECEARLENLNIPVEAGSADPIVVTASLKPNGPVTLVTNAT